MKKKDTRILLVDDEPDILEILDYNLTSEGFQVEKAKTGIEALQKVAEWKPHLVLLDVMMPEMDGIEACEIIRNDSEIGNSLIVFLSARGEDYSQIAGFKAGADDYITKPVKPKVLKSKIKSLLRRISKDEEDLIKLGSLIVDRSGYKVTLSGKEVSLPRKEFELLFLLCSKPGKVFKREFILESVWGKDVVVGDRTIDVHIRKLREKLGDHHIATVKGIGYKFIT